MSLAPLPLPCIWHTIFCTCVGSGPMAYTIVHFPLIGAAIRPGVAALAPGHVAHKVALLDRKSFFLSSLFYLVLYRCTVHVYKCLAHMRYCEALWKLQTTVIKSFLWPTSYFNPSARVKTPCPSISPLQNIPFTRKQWLSSIYVLSL